jgi:hypothetical protein
MNRRHFTRCAIALTFTFGLACGSDTTAPVVVTSVVGTWKLTAVNSAPLPYLISVSDPKLELIAKGFVISATGTFTTSFTLRATELDGTVTTGTTSDSGTVTLANNVATFTYASDGSGAVASVTPTTMTIGGAATQEFTRQ